jgi:hypothetical protein
LNWSMQLAIFHLILKRNNNVIYRLVCVILY